MVLAALQGCLEEKWLGDGAMIIQGDSLHIPLADESIDSVVTDPPYGISFMNRKWDYDVPSVALWKEVLRVMKPGAHALVACGTRTQHRMAVNLEDAGFEIRDCIVYAYGSGFPKSLNIGKSVDRLSGESISTTYIPNGKNKTYGKNLGGGITDSTPSNNEWNGWGTALKPAVELWTLCRKPLSEKTIIENVIKHGAGGINIDGCRVPMNEVIKRPSYATGKVTNAHMEMRPWMLDRIKKGIPLKNDFVNSSGRFPANLIHDGSDEVVSLFPVTGKSQGGKSGHTAAYQGGYKQEYYGDIKPGFGDSGSASRFFYCAKSSKSERNKGLDGFEKKQTTGGGGLTVCGDKFGSIKAVQQNNHPTVKPVALMRYLCRLITPKNGIVLDPFCGSGSTGVAAKDEDFKFIGIEREHEYANIAYHRFNYQQRNCQIPII